MQGAPKNWDRVFFGIRYFNMALIGKVLHFDFRSLEYLSLRRIFGERKFFF